VQISHRLSHRQFSHKRSTKGLNPNDYDKWTDNDMDWTNTETERINLMMVDFKKNEFEISDVNLSHLNKELLIKGKFNKNKIEINIKKV